MQVERDTEVSIPRLPGNFQSALRDQFACQCSEQFLRMFEKPKNHCCRFLFYWVAYVENIIYRPLALFFIIVPFSALENRRLESERWCLLWSLTRAPFSLCLGCFVLSSMPLVFAIIILAAFEFRATTPPTFFGEPSQPLVKWNSIPTDGLGEVDG